MLKASGAVRCSRWPARPPRPPRGSSWLSTHWEKHLHNENHRDGATGQSGQEVVALLNYAGHETPHPQKERTMRLVNDQLAVVKRPAGSEHGGTLPAGPLIPLSRCPQFGGTSPVPMALIPYIAEISASNLASVAARIEIVMGDRAEATALFCAIRWSISRLRTGCGCGEDDCRCGDDTGGDEGSKTGMSHGAISVVASRRRGKPLCRWST